MLFSFLCLKEGKIRLYNSNILKFLPKYFTLELIYVENGFLEQVLSTTAIKGVEFEPTIENG